MKLKAQNTIEIISMVSVVLVVVVATLMFTNGQKLNLSNLSAININNGQQNQIIKPTQQINTITNSVQTDIETAGTLSNTVANMNETEIIDKLSNKTNADLLTVKSVNNEDVFDLANTLIDNLALTVSPFDKNDLTDTTKAALAKVAVDAKNKLGSDNTSSTYGTYTVYISLLNEIMQ